jgi:hypothetical protein
MKIATIFFIFCTPQQETINTPLATTSKKLTKLNQVSYMHTYYIYGIDAVLVRDFICAKIKMLPLTLAF